ncbi:NlpC/P60 family protein [Lachnospiraceae bacterium XBB1006]|nr:NlpC/P60 family protein [Lachnospiraceae bacterium XBB1006]
MIKRNWRFKILTLAIAGALLFGSAPVYAETPDLNTEEAQEDGTVNPEEETPEEPEIHSIPMKVCVRSLSLYLEPNTYAASIAVPYREEVEVTDYAIPDGSAEWIMVYYKDNTYYMQRNDETESLSAYMPEPAYRGNTPYQQRVMDLLKDIVENWKTQYGHNSSNGVPNKKKVYTFDCSGLAAYTANQAMQPFMPVYRLSTSIINLYNMDLIYNEGFENELRAKTVCSGTLEESKLEPGDVLFFNLYTEEDGTQSAKGYNHCGIYIGNGEMVHSSHSFDGKVRVMPISGIYEKNFVLARRYLPTQVSTLTEHYYTTLTGTKIYKERSTASKVAAVMPIESPVDVMCFGPGKWVYVKTGTGVCGFVMKKNLCKNFAEQNIMCYVRTSSVKLCRLLTTKKDYMYISRGDVVQYIGRVGASDYFEVSYAGQRFYIYSKNGIKKKLSTGVVYPD